MIDKSELGELSEELISAFEQIAQGAEAHPERVSSFSMTSSGRETASTGRPTC